jgi:hypothetical protein
MTVSTGRLSRADDSGLTRTAFLDYFAGIHRSLPAGCRRAKLARWIRQCSRTGLIAIAQIRHFFSKVVGVTQNNADGTWRQMAVGHCQPGEPLRFVADPGNPHDENAIKVMRASDEQLGYLNRDLAEELIAKTLEGYSYVVAVASVTESLHGDWHGCNILIFEADPETSLEELEAYAVSHARELIAENG